MVVRELFARLGLDIDGASFTKGDVLMGGMKKAAVAIGAAVFGIGAAVVGLIAQQANAADKMGDLAAKTGVSAESFQRLASAANKLEGTGPEEFAGAMVHLTRNMAAAKAGTEETAGAFNKLGVKVGDGRGHLRNVDEVMLDLADKFSKMPDSAEKTALAVKVFGKAGADMIPVLNHGRAELEAYAASATIFTDEQLKAGEEIGIVWRGITGSGKGLLREVIGPLLPKVAEFLKGIKAWVSTNRDLLRQRLAEVIGAMVAVFKALVWVVGKVGAAFNWLATNWKLVAIVFGATLAVLAVGFAGVAATAIGAAIASAAAWIAALLPFLLLVALIAGIGLLAEDLWVTLHGGEGLMDELWTKWHKFVDDWTGTQAPGGDPWWKLMLKDFVDSIMNIGESWDAAIHDWKIMFEEFGDWLANFITNGAMGEALRLGRGGAATPGSQAVGSIFSGGAGDRFGGGTTPATSARSSSATRSTVVSAPLKAEINISGVDADTAKSAGIAAREELQSWHDDRMEETIAAVSSQ